MGDRMGGGQPEYVTCAVAAGEGSAGWPEPDGSTVGRTRETGLTTAGKQAGGSHQERSRCSMIWKGQAVAAPCRIHRPNRVGSPRGRGSLVAGAPRHSAAVPGSTQGGSSSARHAASERSSVSGRAAARNLAGIRPLSTALP